jgi:hypothetical protein
MNLDWSNNPEVLRNSKYDIVSLSARATAAKFDSIKALNPSVAAARLSCLVRLLLRGALGYTQTMGPFSTTDRTTATTASSGT